MRYHLTPVRMALSTRQVITSVGEVVETKQHSFTAGGNINWYIHYGNGRDIPLKIKNRVII